jgi:hypothetical protein
VQKVLDDDSGVRLGGIGLDIRQARLAEVAKDEMHIRIKGRNKRCMGRQMHLMALTAARVGLVDHRS